MSSKLKLVISVAVVLAAVAVVAWREAGRPNAPALVETLSPQVVMFVDLSEENEEEGCGAIIRAVRSAAGRGVVTREVDARDPGEHAERYRLLTAPSVVLFDERGVETVRLEGESAATIQQIRVRLDAVTARR